MFDGIECLRHFLLFTFWYFYLQMFAALPDGLSFHASSAKYSNVSQYPPTNRLGFIT